MLWTIQAVSGASIVAPFQYLDMMESIYAAHGLLNLYRWMDYSNQGFRAIQLQLDKPISTARGLDE